MRRVTVPTILADWRMVPKKRTPFFGMAGVTQTIDRKLLEHLPPLTAMRIVARSAADLHVAKLSAEQMGGALEQSFPLFRVAAETGFFYAKTGQHLIREFDLLRICYWTLHFGSLAGGHRPLGEFGVVYIVARHATHIASFVLACLPAKTITIARVTLKAGCVCPSSLLWGLQLGRVINVVGRNAFFSVLNMPFAISVTALTHRGARVVQEFRGLAVGFHEERIHIRPVTLHTLHPILDL